jgi:membrane protein
MKEAQTDNKGRNAEKPSHFPAPAWKDIALRVKDEQTRDNLSIVAAGVAFYFILAMPPALASAVSIYGLVADPQQVSQQLNAISGMMPGEVSQILNDQLTRVTQQSGGALSFGMIIGLLLTLWSANKGTKALITSLNIVYDEEEDRGFFKLNLWSLMLTVGGIVGVLIVLGLLVALPALIDKLPLSSIAQGIFRYARWPLMACMVVVGLALIYRLAPDREQPKWRWVSWGSVIATLLWMIGSFLFSYYVSNFGDYNKTYGSMGAIAILMLWFFLSTYVVLLGAEINAEMEHQTQKDSTTGEPRPIGERKAYVADTVASRQNE